MVERSVGCPNALRMRRYKWRESAARELRYLGPGRKWTFAKWCAQRWKPGAQSV
jgi:hypothetical protein